MRRYLRYVLITVIGYAMPAYLAIQGIINLTVPRWQAIVWGVTFYWLGIWAASVDRHNGKLRSQVVKWRDAAYTVKGDGGKPKVIPSDVIPEDKMNGKANGTTGAG
jgi:hypothetical protein